MARGVKTGGRQKGTPNKINAAIKAEIIESGETPLAYMLRVMRDPTVEHSRRDWAADKAAPYVHSRLASTEVTGKDGGPIETTNNSPRDIARAVLAVLREAEVEK